MTILLEHPLAVFTILFGLLLLCILVAFNLGKPLVRKSKSHRRRSPKKLKGLSLVINPADLVDELGAMAPSEQKTKKQEYLGKLVEIPTIVGQVTRSERGDPYRRLELFCRDRRSIQVSGEVDTSVYQDKSWMTREGQVLVRGRIRDFSQHEFLLDDLQLV